MDAIRTKAFETYIRRNCDSWLEFASINDLDVRLEDIIFVTGCDLTSSWAMATFVNSLNPEMTLHVRTSQAGSATFQWNATNQPHHNEPDQVRQSLSSPTPTEESRTSFCRIVFSSGGFARNGFSPFTRR